MYLNCHSFHSLRFGTIPLEELAAQASHYGVKAMALTDVNTVTGIYDFIKACHEAAIHPVVGMEFRDAGKFRYITLARNAQGLSEINRLRTAHNFDGTPLPLQPPNFENVFVVYAMDFFPEKLADWNCNLKVETFYAANFCFDR
ncbi:PHP domain-containing protein [Sphingobacterium siyangense]|uniref:PHP domain-containing protein n=1 Tax=Sphingobacterium siyangense TaxID=459529 RepID=UPI003DA40123